MEPLTVQQPTSSTTKVSVIIPSVGRNSLRDAIRSAREQRGNFTIEVIVIFDLPHDRNSTRLRELASGADSVQFTGGGRKGGHARNRGVELATGDWVAFLDDDDSWTIDKLEKQLDLASATKDNGRNLVVGCRVVLVSDDTGLRVNGVPARLVAQSELIEDYLFRKRRPGALRASFFTSTILVPAELARRVPWREDLVRHQDWDWLVRIGRSTDVTFAQVEEDLVFYSLGSPGSVSASGDWASSLAWAEDELKTGARSTYADFLTGQTLRYALQAKSANGIRRTIAALWGAKCFPSIGPVLIAAGGIIPRRALQRVMAFVR